MSRNVVSCEILIKICILFLIVAKRITNASRLSCVCNLAECENVNDADCPSGAGTVWDSCKCCRICARVEHEPCGGPYDFSGFCAAGLECVVSDFLNKNAIGICTRIFNKDIMCKDPKFVSGCNIVNQSCRCEDSESCTEESPFSFKTRQECQMNLNAMLSQKSEYEDEENDEDINISDGEDDFEGNSCPSDSIFSNDNRCECSPKKCAESATSCNFGFVRTLTHQGTNKPGDCCDIYQCIQNSSKDCSNVICPGIPSCPPDSYQLPTHKSLDDCCAVAQGCQCLPNCEQPNCSPDLVPVIQEEATKKPGRCCPLYNCEKQELQEESHDCLNGDNNYMKNGTVWTSADFCTKCTCVEGKPICHSFACAPCVKPVKVAGQCCPRCDDDCPSECRYIVDENGNKNCECNEKLFAKCENMENCEKNCPFGYKKDKNDCRVCECKKCSKQCSHGYLSNEKGFSICNCKPWNLTSWMKPTINETFSCKIDTNVLREDGETWFDGCRQCSCISGKEMCSLIRCSPFSCSNPIINSTSSCCPFCPDDPFKNEEMNHMVCTSPNGGIMLEGETLMLDNCTQCVCHRGMALCRSKDCPATPCPNPRPPSDGECCATCAVSDNVYDEPPNSYSGNDVHCTASQINATIWREGSCVSCRCVRNKKRCYTELCDVFNKCEHSLTIKGKCCPICVADADRYRFERMCVYDNSTYKNGEEWTLDACTKCKCVYGHLECTQKICSKSCTNAVRKSDKCCLSCSDEENADFRNDQEIFYIVILLMMVCGGIILAICLTRHWRSKKQQIRLRDLGCLPPQYQYKYIPNNPYDNKNGSQKSEKASLAPV